jgi:hypothetical protein
MQIISNGTVETTKIIYDSGKITELSELGAGAYIVIRITADWCSGKTVAEIARKTITNYHGEKVPQTIVELFELEKLEASGKKLEIADASE